MSDPAAHPRVIVLGAGAIGTLVAALLARGGTPVSLLTRSRPTDLLRTGRIAVELLPSGRRLSVEVPATTTDRPTSEDICLLAMKANQLSSALDRLRGRETATIVTLQNGIDAGSLVARSLPNATVLAGAIRVLAERVSPGHVRVLGALPHLIVGSPDRGQSDRADEVSLHLSRAGLATDASPDMPAVLWAKLCFMMPFAYVGAIHDQTASGITSDPELCQEVAAMAQEVREVAESQGITLAGEAVDVLDALANLPADAVTSLHRDLAAKRPTEIDYLSGAVLRRAEQAGIEAPITRSYHERALSRTEAHGRNDEPPQESQHR